ncbi:folate receptor beta-like [Mercenaria mercenaria]|uniref:folate receptor beta-like n=1 Tax=Mercenaria mercenaria TaxID=6596 RepID=UPI00234F1E67|nr:folate receptor beta-like [Mercenaria mercenaria]
MFSTRLLALVSLCALVSTKEHPDLLNTCFDARYHKDTPSPEEELHGQCAPWKDRSCCYYNTTKAFHDSDVWLGFTYNHCGPDHSLSETCRQWFNKDMCFYDCSPNTGPWIVDNVIRIRNERFMHVPFCASQCNAWWEACKNEFTCHDTWGKGFNYSTGINTCPNGKICRPFAEIYENDATTFCEKIWYYSWKVVPDDQPCMKIDFTGKNPNDDVTKFYAGQRSGVLG